ncbi:MAG: hypothetical protein AAF564_13465 [Bacteroidota bacterium]
MSFFQNLIEHYLFPDPKGFNLIATRLKQGHSALEIRNQLMEETGGSRLATGKIVEQVVKAIKIAKINMVSGALLFAFCLFMVLFVAIGLATLFGLVAGAAQFIAGRRVWGLYKQANVQ